MQRIEESELILNPRGAIYHLDLRPEELAPIVLTVGDPGRVELVSRYFDTIDIRRQHREFVTHTGRLGNKTISVISSGIGTDNIDIVMNELDALVNIDFESRLLKTAYTSLQVLRLGTSGSLQRDIPVDALVAGTHGLGIDNLLNFYRIDQNDEEKQLLHAFVTHTQLHQPLAHPSIASASPSLLKHFVEGFHHGLTVTCPGFYGPQGRVLRLGLRQPMLVESLSSFQYGPYRIANFEMETSAIYGLGRALGHQCLSLNVIVANRIARKFSTDPHQAVVRLIEKALGIIAGW